MRRMPPRITRGGFQRTALLKDESERTGAVRQLLVVAVFVLCTLGVVFDDLVRSAMEPPGVDFLGGSPCATWPTHEVSHKPVICKQKSLPDEEGAAKKGRAGEVRRLVDMRGRCSQRQKSCALLLTNRGLGGLGDAAECEGLHVMHAHVLGGDGTCQLPSLARRGLWWFFYSVQTLELCGFALGMYATARWRGLAAANEAQLFALRALLYTQVFRIVADLAVLVGFDFTVAPLVTAEDAERVHQQLYPFGPSTFPVGIGYFILALSFVALIYVLIELDTVHRKITAEEKKPLLGLNGSLNPAVRGAVRDAVRQQAKERARLGEDRARSRAPPSPAASRAPEERSRKARKREDPRGGAERNAEEAAPALDP